MAFYFLRDRAGGASLAEREWIALDAEYPSEMQRILTHITRVEAQQTLENNTALKMASSIENDLYYWEANNVFVIYHYDGHDLVLVHLGVNNSQYSYQERVATALRRL